VAFVKAIIGVAPRTDKDIENLPLPGLIKKHPNEAEIVLDKAREAFLSTNEGDMKLIEELTQKGVSLLPETERLQFVTLADRFMQGGYGGLTEDEIATMQKLNRKACDLLPRKDRERLLEIIKKTSDEVSRSMGK
jgi:hypothetical protein